MPFFICPNCRERSIDHDRQEGLTREAVACHRCGFGFLFELMDDYYPAPGTGLVVCDQKSRILASGRGVFELTGYREDELMGREVMDGLDLRATRTGAIPRSWRSNGACDGSANGSSCVLARASVSRSPLISSPPTTTTAACWSRSRRVRSGEFLFDPGLQLLQRCERVLELAQLGVRGALVDAAEQAE